MSNINKQARIDAAEKFFNLLFGAVNTDKFSYLWTKQNQETYPFNIVTADNRRNMAVKAIELNDAGFDVYIGVNLGDEPATHKTRYTAEQVTLQTATIADIDIEGGHVNKADKVYPPTFDTARAFLPFKPTLLVDSGFGLHAYCLYQEPIAITADNREDCIKRNKNFISVIKNRAGVFGGAVDGVHDLPRILRVPGTFNYRCGKDNAPLCHVVEVNDVRFTPASLDDALKPFLPKPATLPKQEAGSSARRTFNDGDEPTDRERAEAMLKFIPLKDLSGDDWLAASSSLKNLGFTYAEFDALNQGGDHYNERKNQSRWNSWNDPSYDIATLHGIAKRFGYSEKDFQREWHAERRQVTKSTRRHEPRQEGGYSAMHDAERLSDEQRANLFGNTSHTDRANAKRLAYLFGDRLRYLQDVDKWLTYDGGIWTKAANARNGAIMPFIDRTAELLKANAETDAEHKIAACFENARKAAPAITFLKGIKTIIVKQADLDNHPYLFNCLNGVVNLQDGKLYPADPSLLLTRQAAAEFKGIDYRDPDNLAEKFLQDIMPNDETREGLLRFLGYALSGVIREQVAQFWRGDGANGKSTLINLLMEVLNTYATKIPNAAILASNKPADADRATTALNSLDGARLAIFDELPQNARLNTALFKTLAGGDKITIRRLHEEGVTIKPTAKIILSGNFNPQLDNTGDFGCSRKIRNLPFNETFTGDRADDRLLEKLLTADARAALLALLVDAARRWHKDGLTESAQMKAAKTDYLAENDFLEEFISENCEFGDGFIELKIFVRKLRDAYEDETRIISDRNLKDMLKRRLDGKDGVKYGLHHKTRRAGFHGIRWNDTADYDFGGTPINPKDEDIPDFTR